MLPYAPIKAIHWIDLRQYVRKGVWATEDWSRYLSFAGRIWLNKYYRSFQVGQRAGLADVCTMITRPTSIIWGDSDPYNPLRIARELASLLPNSSLEGIAGAGHFVAEERPADGVRDLHHATRACEALISTALSHRSKTMEKRPSILRDFLSMYGLFLLCYTATHLRFEWSFWMRDDFAVFAKYALGDSPEAHLAVAKLVYFSKATWMIVLVWLCALRLPFRRALAISFVYYAIALLFLFPINVYIALNLLLAAGFAFEEWRLARSSGGDAADAGAA